MADNRSGNVVQIQDFAGLTRKLGPSSSSRLLHDCRNTVLDRTADALARAMDNIDDTLFALADKASNNTLQTHYFDAMREIRIKRKDIESAFRDHFKEGSDKLIDNKFPLPSHSSEPTLSDIGLSLIEDDDLEETLAITALVEKIANLCHNDLYGLDKRVGLLLGKKELETEHNPIGPKTLCTAFNSACGKIESGVDIKLIVFKLIDLYICETIQQIYRDINNHLAMSGILPKIPTQMGGTETAQVHNGGETDFLSAFSQLLNTNASPGGFSGQTGQPAQGVPGGAYPLTSGMPGVFAGSGQGGSGMVTHPGQGITGNILQNLTLMQRGQWASLGIDSSSIDTAALADGSANVLWSIKNDPSTSNGDNGDEMVIEIVALLFDYIFDNQKVSDKAKALIGRLQIPVLKAAMLDNTFFSMKSHPARRLLNTLAQSTTGLLKDSDEYGEFYKGIAACVQKVLDEFDTDIGVFESALEELEALIEAHQGHFDANIEEAKKLIQGRERLMIADSMAGEEVERRLEGKPYPQFIRDFATDNWKNLLIVIYMKEGHDGDAWRGKLEMLDLLIWSTLPKATLNERKQLVGMLPTLLSGVEDGMKMLSMPQSEQDQFMEKLANCHTRLVNAESQPTDTMDRELNTTMNKPIDVQTDSSLEEDSSHQTAAPKSSASDSIMVEEIKLIGQGKQTDSDDTLQESSQRLDVRLNLFGDDTAADLEKLAAELGVEADSEAQEPLVIEDECSELVRNMVPGIWFEFHQEDGSKSMERLAWISAILGSYLFTNHEGLKTRELSTQELEESLRSGHAVLAEDLSFLVDSSFNSLLDDMQKKVAG